MRKQLLLSLTVLGLFLGAGLVDAKAEEAARLSVSITKNEKDIAGNLIDDQYDTMEWVNTGDELVIKAEDYISGLYIEWYTPPSQENVCVEGAKGVTFGGKGLVHEYVELSGDFRECSIRFESSAIISTLHVFAEGTLPSGVQNWKVCEGPVDLMVFPAAAGEEVSLYEDVIRACAEQNRSLLVMYLINYDSETFSTKRHDMLNALWNMGVRYYPIDAGAEDIVTTELELARVQYDQEGIQKKLEAALKKYQPYVVVGHEFDAEMMNVVAALWGETLVKACEEIGTDSSVQKLYLRNYNGETFGLYSSTVGFDTGSDIFEHVKWPEEVRPVEGNSESEMVNSTEEQSVSAIADVKEDGLNVLGIIGLVLIGIGVLILAGSAIYTVMWKQSKKKKEKQ